MSLAIDILNKARAELKWEDRIPEINQTNLHELSLLNNNDMNDFLNIVAKITRQYVYDTTFSVEDNPFASMYGEMLPVGGKVEDIYVDLITGSVPAWNDDGSVALSRKLPNVQALYHSVNYENQYKVSTSKPQMQTAFLTENGMNNLVSRINGTLNSSAQYDLYLHTLNLISTAINRGAMKFKGSYSLASEAGIKGFLKDLKTTVKDFKFMNNKYNYFGYTTKTPESDIIIITKPKFLATIDVDYLAGVFNLDKSEIKNRIIEVPDDYGFGDLDESGAVVTPIAIVMDRRMLRIFPTLFEGSAMFNAASLTFNNFLTLRYIFSYGLFFNAVCFIEESVPTITVTNTATTDYITVSPATVSWGADVTITAVTKDDYTVTYYSGYEDKRVTENVSLDVGETFTFRPDYDTTGVVIDVAS